jgi:hypothetical protein
MMHSKVHLILKKWLFLRHITNSVWFNIYCSFSLSEADQKRKEEEEKIHDEAVEYPNKKRNMLVSGMVAMSAMLGYAFMSGLVQVEIADTDDAKKTRDMHHETQNINLSSTGTGPTGMFEDNQRAQDENGNTA